jgi:hypothetical protein
MGIRSMTMKMEFDSGLFWPEVFESRQSEAGRL